MTIVKTIQRIRIRDIAPNPNQGPINLKTVDMLEASMGRVGKLFTPIAVKRARGGYELLAGAHRKAAAERLAWDWIDAEIIDDENLARSLAASDNILRNHGTALSRADAWAEYVRSEFPKMKPRGGPHDKGLTKIANALGVSRRTLSRSLKWAGLSSSVKQMLFGNGLDRSATFLTELSARSLSSEWRN